MKDKNLLFVVGVLLWQMASGLEMCKGPFQPPSIDDVSVDPVYGSGTRKVPIGGRIVVKMTSSVPLTARWNPRQGAPVEENPHFKSSMTTDGDKYIFMAEDRLQGNRSDIVKLAKYTTLRVAAHYAGCNNIVHYIFTVSVLQEMVQQSGEMPTIEEMPFQRYTMVDLVWNTATLSFTVGDNGTLNAGFRCEKMYVRSRGVLKPYYHIDKTFSTTRYKFKTMKATAGIAEGKCIGPIDDNIGVEVKVNVSPSVSFLIVVTTAFHGQDISKPAVGVETEPFWNWRYTEMLVIPATRNTTRFTCMTDAETVGNVTLHLDLGGNEKKLLTPTYNTTDGLVPTIRYFVYDIESPPENWIQDYEFNVVERDGRQNSITFQVGAAPIRVGGQTKTIYLNRLNDSTVNKVHVLFSGLGSPEVNLKVYAGVHPSMYSLDAEEFQQTFDGHRLMTDSKDHRLFFEKRGAMMQGQLIVPDVRKLVPSGYWDDLDNYVYSVVFLTYRKGESKLAPIVNIYRNRHCDHNTLTD